MFQNAATSYITPYGNFTLIKKNASIFLKMKEHIEESHSSLPKAISEHIGIAGNSFKKISNTL